MFLVPGISIYAIRDIKISVTSSLLSQVEANVKSFENKIQYNNLEKISNEKI